MYSQGNSIYFRIFRQEYNIGYIPIQFDNGEWGYEKIGICDIKKAEEQYDGNSNYDPYVWFETVDKMLEEYRINNIPLGELLDKIENIGGIPCV